MVEKRELIRLLRELVDEPSLGKSLKGLISDSLSDLEQLVASNLSKLNNSKSVSGPVKAWRG